MCGADTSPSHDVLRKRLGPLDLSGLLGRPEYLKTGLPKFIRDSGNQWDFWADDDQVRVDLCC